jgi:pimeloyl-ACP methyl ester carboxylesterase
MVDTLLTQLKAERYALYVMDYGAPVGYRLAVKHPRAGERADRPERQRL